MSVAGGADTTVSLELLWAGHKGQRWRPRFSWALLPGFPGVQIPRAFYGQEILLALFRDRPGPSPHSPFLVFLGLGIPSPWSPLRPWVSAKAPTPASTLPGPQQEWTPRAEA